MISEAMVVTTRRFSRKGEVGGGLLGGGKEIAFLQFDSRGPGGFEKQPWPFGNASPPREGGTYRNLEGLLHHYPVCSLDNTEAERIGASPLLKISPPQIPRIRNWASFFAGGEGAAANAQNISPQGVPPPLSVLTEMGEKILYGASSAHRVYYVGGGGQGEMAAGRVFFARSPPSGALGGAGASRKHGRPLCPDGISTR